MKLYHSLTFVLLAISVTCFAQKDTSKTASVKHDVNPKHLSVLGRFYIGGGIGQSTILSRIYYAWDPPEFVAFGISQSIVYNGNFDYGITGRSTLGIGVAYQTASGVPYGTQPGYTPYFNTEQLTRLNVSIRWLRYMLSTQHTQIYTGLRIGASFWTDYVTSNTGYGPVAPTLGSTKPIYVSVQIPVGVKFFEGPFGLHLELAIGTPYFAEGGITIRI